MESTVVDKAREQRVRHIENALASVRMEGLEPSEDAKLLFQRYIEGNLDIGELGQAVDQLLDDQ